jgi:hypothetical protein
MGPSVPAHIGAGTPGRVITGGPRRLGRWSQPAFGAGSAPRDPEERLGRDWRAGTIGAGAYRRRRTGMLVKKEGPTIYTLVFDSRFID